MTISEMIVLVYDQLAPFLFAVTTSIALSLAIAFFRCHFTANGVQVGLISLFGIGLTATLLSRKRGITEAVAEYLERKKGYWMIYVVNTAGNYYAVFGPLTIEARDAQLKVLHEGEGMHFVVPLAEGEDGFVFVGCKNPHPRLGDEALDMIQRELPWWKVVPIHLSSGWSELGANRIALKDRFGEVSPGLSIQVAAQFIRSAPIGWLGEEHNNWPMALKAMMDRHACHREESAKNAAALDQAIAAMLKAARDLHSDGRYILSPSDMKIVRQPIVKLLDGLLAPDDPRRGMVDFPPKPLADITPAANKPPSTEGTPPATGDDGHCCCGGL